MPSPEHFPSREEEASLTAIFLSTHDELWAQMDSSDAAFLRLVIAKAQEITNLSGEVAGQAYLAGVAVGHAAELVLKASEAGAIPTLEDELANLAQAS